MNLLESFILGAVQGTTEFLPISSSGHLALLQNLFGFEESSIFFDTLIHFATLLVIIYYFRKEIYNILANLKDKENIKIIVFLILATIPVGFIGFLLKDKIEQIFSSLFLIALCFLLNSFILFLTKFFKEIKIQLSFFDALFIGFFQMLAVMPGISRSGSTLSASLFRGIKKEIAFKFSFLLAIPLILGATILQIFTIDINLIQKDWLPNIVGFLTALVFGFISIRILQKVILKLKIHYFALYCLILGVILLFF